MSAQYWSKEPEEKVPLEGLEGRWEDNIKIDLKAIN
jgi:hypothetical protein